MTRRYPAAEQWLSAYRMPVKACEVTKELYGYVRPVVDVDRVRRDALAAGHRGEALDRILIAALDYRTD